MNINEHPLYKDIYDLCQEIEKLPASEQATKVVVMASNLERPVAQLLSLEKKIKAAFPEIEPSGGHDYVDELIGLLRVARMHIKDSEDRCVQVSRKHDAVTSALSRYLVASKGHVADSWMELFIEVKAITFDASYPTGFIAPVLILPAVNG
jgi:hypothetical protein